MTVAGVNENACELFHKGGYCEMFHKANCCNDWTYELVNNFTSSELVNNFTKIYCVLFDILTVSRLFAIVNNHHNCWHCKNAMLYFICSWGLGAWGYSPRFAQSLKCILLTELWLNWSRLHLQLDLHQYSAGASNALMVSLASPKVWSVCCLFQVPTGWTVVRSETVKAI